MLRPVDVTINRYSDGFSSYATFPTRELSETIIAKSKKQKETLPIPFLTELTSTLSIRIVKKSMKGFRIAIERVVKLLLATAE